MIWQDYAKQLKKVLALDGSPVGVTFSDTPAGNGKKTKIMPCAAFYQAARKGATFNISAETCACPGGSTFLGLSAPSPERAALTRKFLIEGEKFSSCNASFFRGRVLNQGQPPLGAAKYVVVARWRNSSSSRIWSCFSAIRLSQPSCRLINLRNRDSPPGATEWFYLWRGCYLPPVHRPGQRHLSGSVQPASG